MPFTKLDSEFPSSSLFAHGLEVVGFWAYLLSQADRDGRVHATVPDMMARCRAPERRIRELLTILEQPDRWSRTPDNDGRRIRVERAPRWCVVILNHGAYRQKDTNAERQKRWRQAHRNVTPVTPVISSASASVSVVVGDGGVGEEGPPLSEDALAERKIRDSKVTGERRLLQLVARLEACDPKQRDAPALMQLVTSYDKRDGTRIGGCVNPATLSYERVQKSIADAEELLRQWGGSGGA